MIKPRIITCAGYYGTGSSAVTDFVSEFDNVLSFGDFEFTILFDVDGVRDLEYNIVENYDRHKSSHAVKKFKKLIDYLSGISFFRMYEKFFDGEFNRISCDFLDKLIVGKYRSVWREDLRDRGYAFRIRKYVIKKIFKILSLGLYKTKTSLPREEAFLVKSLTENEFCELVKEYVNQLVCSLNKEHGKEVIMLDQFLPSSHISDHSKYCENIKCLVVERDPRDIYLLEKEVWKSNCVPADVAIFCKWFRLIREHRKKEVYDSKVVKLIYFEDMVYNYDTKTKEIINFLGLNEKEHIYKKEIFDPKISIANTKLYNMQKFNSYRKDIEFIECELEEFLYR